MTHSLKQYIKDNIHLIDSLEYQELYSNCDFNEISDLTEFLLSCGLKPDEHMTELPGRYLSNSSIESYSVSDSVKKILNMAFYNCSKLKDIVIGKNVIVICGGAFSDCYELTRVDIPQGVKSIAQQAFAECVSMSSISLPNTIRSIGYSAFSNCNSIENIYYGGDISQWLSIEFSDCTSNPCYSGGVLHLGGVPVKNINIPQGIESIHDCAFAGCSFLTNISIPSSVKNIGDYAFYNCNVKNFTFRGTINEWHKVKVSPNSFYHVTNNQINCLDGVTNLVKNYH